MTLRHLAYLGLLAAMLGGCARAAPRASLDREEPLATGSCTRCEQDLSQRISAALVATRTHLEQEYRPPKPGPRLRCADETLLRSDATVIARVRDARLESRAPLPLALLASLESDEFSPIVAHLSGGSASLWDTAHIRLVSADSARKVFDALTRLQARSYLAELRVEAYAEPKLFRRKDALKSEWDAGQLKGRLVVYDVARGHALCQAPIAVQGDATAVPILRRLREANREKLRADLYDRTWLAMNGALSSISSVLRLPDATRRNHVAQRWAAPPEPGANLTRAKHAARN